MVNPNRRFMGPRVVVGPRVGVVSINGGKVTVSVLEDGERSPLPRSVIHADDETAERVASALQSVAAKVRASLTQFVPVVVA